MKKKDKVKKVKSNKLSKAEQFGLRMRLLKIWFVKNLYIMFWVFFIVCIGLTFSGIIKPGTPILGAIFGDLSQKIEDVISELGGNMTVYSVLESIISLGLVIGLCMTKLKRICLSDIRSKKTKIMLIKAGLYFNENGKLAKRIETITKTDLDGDGKIGDKKAEEVEQDENIIEGLRRAGEEFVTIVTLDLSNVEKDKEDEVYKTTGLDETKEGVDEFKVAAVASGAKLLDPSIDVDKEVVKAKKNKIRSVKNYFKNFFSDIKKAMNLNVDPDEKVKKQAEKQAAKAKKEEKKNQKKQLRIEAKKQKELAQKQREEQKKREAQLEAAEKARIKKLEMERREMQKESAKQAKENPVAPQSEVPHQAYTSAQAQLRDILNKKR